MCCFLFFFISSSLYFVSFHQSFVLYSCVPTDTKQITKMQVEMRRISTNIEQLIFVNEYKTAGERMVDNDDDDDDKMNKPVLFVFFIQQSIYLSN